MSDTKQPRKQVEIEDLEVKTSNGAYELRVFRVFRQVFSLEGGIQTEISAREHRHREVVLVKQRLELLGLGGKPIDRRGPQLNALEAERGDVLNGLDVVAAPGDGRVAEGDARGSSQGYRRRQRGGSRRQEVAPGRGRLHVSLTLPAKS